MGSSAEKELKRWGRDSWNVARYAADPALSTAHDKGLMRTGKSAAERAAKEQQNLIKAQGQREKQRLAEADNEVSLRRHHATRLRTGRRSLMHSTGSGRSTNLGGTANG